MSEPTPGRRYRVQFTDCCLAGEFTGTLLRIEYKRCGDNLYVFDTGQYEGGATFIPVDTDQTNQEPT